jgi:hypothetical protein
MEVKNMAKSLNFNNVKKQFLTVTLADEKNTTLMIGTPTKAIMDDLTLLQNSMGSENNDEATDDLYNACARVMSRNKAGVKITKEYLEEVFDFEDITIFFTAYMSFIDEVIKSKN